MKGSNLGFQMNSTAEIKKQKELSSTLSTVNEIDLSLNCDEEIVVTGPWTETLKATILTLFLLLVSLLLGVWYITGSDHDY